MSQRRLETMMNEDEIEAVILVLLPHSALEVKSLERSYWSRDILCRIFFA